MNKSLPITGALFMTALNAFAQADQRPNIVFIMTDDHTAQMMSCYGSQHISTPNLDRIANDGVRFMESYVANSLSGPSRACLVTGKHSHKNGFTNNEHGIFDNTQQTMPKLMQAAGYQTALIGKWHLVSDPTGFDHWEILPGQGDYYNPTFITQDGKRHIEKGYCTDIVTDKSIEWMEAHKGSPFMILIHHKTCHRPWLPDLKYLHEYEDKTFPLPENFYDDYEGRLAAQQQEMSIASEHDMDIAYDCKIYSEGDKTRLSDNYVAMVNRLDKEDQKIYWQFYDSITNEFRSHNYKGKELIEAKYQRYMRDYCKVTKSLDDNVGRVLDYLKASGLDDNTLIVYTSDQGFYMGEHGWFDKRFMYEESFHTPLIMRLPKGYEAKGDIYEMVQNIDLAPTFLDMAEAKIPSDIQGISMKRLFKGEHPKDWRKSLYYHFYEFPAEHMVKRHYGVRTDRYKLIHFYNDIDSWELYDLKADPTEMHNIYGQPGTEKITKQLLKELHKLQKQYDDPIEKKLKKGIRD